MQAVLIVIIIITSIVIIIIIIIIAIASQMTVLANRKWETAISYCSYCFIWAIFLYVF